MRWLLLLLALAAGALPARAQTEIDRRTALDGTVVLEDAPEVPARVVEALNRYQNVRSAG